MILHKRMVLTLAGTVVLSSTMTACLEHPVVTPIVKASSPGNVGEPISYNRDVDVLFVIDNSFSMGEEQGKLAANFGAFVDQLEAKEVNANYRIAVVSTDMGSPLCKTTLGSKDGQMRLVSCLDRREEFLGTDIRFNTACASQCEYDSDQLKTVPTSIEGSNDKRSRSWIEREEGKLNLPAGIDAQSAFKCLGPQGITGCGMEEPLEAMLRAIEGSSDPDSPNFGFLRQDAILAVVVVSDELDCSASTVGNKEVFFSENSADWKGPYWPSLITEHKERPSNACFLAGTHCTGFDGERYERCEPADWDASHTMIDDPKVAEKKAVLRPISRYINALRSLPPTSTGRPKEVVVSLIGGVDQATLEPIYRPFGVQDGKPFGLDAGCRSEAAFLEEEDSAGGTIPAGVAPQSAIAPVRLRAVVEAFADADAPADERGLYSICSDDYTHPLRKIGESIRKQFQPACFMGCVKDSEPTTEKLEPECVVTQRVGGEDNKVLPECEKDDEGSYRRDDDRYVVPEHADVCFVYLADPSAWTDDKHDQLDPSCIERDANLQFKVQWREGVKAPLGAWLSAECQLAPLEGQCLPSSSDF